MFDISLNAYSDLKDLELARRSPDHEPDSIQSSTKVNNQEGESLVALLSHSVHEVKAP